MARYLAEEGCAVTGIDVAEGMVEKAVERVVAQEKATVRGKAVEKGMRGRCCVCVIFESMAEGEV